MKRQDRKLVDELHPYQYSQIISDDIDDIIQQLKFLKQSGDYVHVGRTYGISLIEKIEAVRQQVNSISRESMRPFAKGSRFYDPPRTHRTSE